MMNLNQSRVKLWRKCHRAHHYKFVQNIEKKVKGRPLTFGSLVHDALDQSLQGKSREPIFKQYEKQIRGVFEEERIELGLDNVVPSARILLDGYDRHWKNDGLKYLKVEQVIEAPLVPGVTFKGTVDAIVQEKDSRTYLFERKTGKSMPEEGVRMADLQTTVYFWALTIWGFKRKIDGIIWDYIRSIPPSIPQVLKNGGLSKKKIDTLPEVYLAAIKENKLNPKDYEDMLESLESKRKKFYRRIKLPFSKHLRDEVVSDLKETAIDIRDTGETKKDRNLSRDCTFCEFFHLCQAELRGMDADFIRKHDYQTRKERYEKTREE